MMIKTVKLSEFLLSHVNKKTEQNMIQRCWRWIM